MDKIREHAQNYLDGVLTARELLQRTYMELALEYNRMGMNDATPNEFVTDLASQLVKP